MPRWENHPYVYVAHGKHGHKIGISGNAEWRMASIKGSLVRVWHRPGDAHIVERTAHAILDTHLSHGREWFAVPEVVAIDAVAEAIQRVKAGKHKRTGNEAIREKQAKRQAAMEASGREFLAYSRKLDKIIQRCRHQYGPVISGYRMCSRCGNVER